MDTMNWYIFNKDDEPLTFDGKAIEFKKHGVCTGFL